MKVIQFNKTESKHDIVYKDLVFKLEVIPRDFGCTLIYYTTDEVENEFLPYERRYVVGERKVRRRWFDRFLGLSFESKVLFQLKKLKQDVHKQMEQDKEVDGLMRVIYEE